MLTAMQGLEVWRRALRVSVRSASPDLSARQMAVLLAAYCLPPPHTVRGLAADLKISKPAVTRSLDRLEQLGLARRKTDARDRRSIVVQRTVAGAVFLSDFGQAIARAAADTADRVSRRT